MKSEKIKCKTHCWIPFLDHNFELKPFSPLGYYRICANCGIIKYRDRLEEWKKLHYQQVKEYYRRGYNEK